ncbi:hypothetical protein [Limnohabitans sp. JirII-29]|uniref:hypothetical protein n=1 Tax=Limnohabitans sp. JirII-29 TaxID=1835756 RepID=UPI0011B29A1F|nr:hypothetical protein [Limnohabitans sp. JirII-29]
MVLVMMMLELCAQWLWPLQMRSFAHIATNPRSRPAPRATAIHMAHAQPGTRLAPIHAPTHRRPR